MKPWLKRILVGMFGATVLFGGLAACSHRHHGYGHGWQAMSEEDAAKMKTRIVDKVGSRLELDDAQKAKLGVLADKLREQRNALVAGGDPRSEFASVLPETHEAFFKNLRLHHTVGDYVFVHAGLKPRVPLGDQRESDLLWIREEFLDSPVNFGRIVVHGHTPANAPEVRNNRIGIDTGAYMTGNLTAVVLEGRTRQFLSTS